MTYKILCFVRSEQEAQEIVDDLQAKGHSTVYYGLYVDGRWAIYVPDDVVI